MAVDERPIERRVFIPARPETVFKFLVDPELMARWIGRALFASAEDGGLFCLQFTFGEGHTAAGVFTEVSPPNRVAFSFGWEGSKTLPPGGSLVEIDLTPEADGTSLRLRHSGLPDLTEPIFTPERHGDRWSHYLARLTKTV